MKTHSLELQFRFDGFNLNDVISLEIRGRARGRAQFWQWSVYSDNYKRPGILIRFYFTIWRTGLHVFPSKLLLIVNLLFCTDQYSVRILNLSLKEDETPKEIFFGTNIFFG